LGGRSGAGVAGVSSVLGTGVGSGAVGLGRRKWYDDEDLEEPVGHSHGHSHLSGASTGTPFGIGSVTHLPSVSSPSSGAVIGSGLSAGRNNKNGSSSVSLGALSAVGTQVSEFDPNADAFVPSWAVVDDSEEEEEDEDRGLKMNFVEKRKSGTREGDRKNINVDGMLSGASASLVGLKDQNSSRSTLLDRLTQSSAPRGGSGAGLKGVNWGEEFLASDNNTAGAIHTTKTSPRPNSNNNPAGFSDMTSYSSAATEVSVEAIEALETLKRAEEDLKKVVALLESVGLNATFKEFTSGEVATVAGDPYNKDAGRVSKLLGDVSAAAVARVSLSEQTEKSIKNKKSEMEVLVGKMQKLAEGLVKEVKELRCGNGAGVSERASGSKGGVDVIAGSA
jgi:hypothetical protein